MAEAEERFSASAVPDADGEDDLDSVFRQVLSKSGQRPA
jgi:hypothetical protein